MPRSGWYFHDINSISFRPALPNLSGIYGPCPNESTWRGDILRDCPALSAGGELHFVNAIARGFHDVCIGRTEDLRFRKSLPSCFTARTVSDLHRIGRRRTSIRTGGTDRHNRASFASPRSTSPAS